MNICALMEVVLLASLAHVLARRARLTLDIATHCGRQCLLLDDSQRRQHADSAPCTRWITRRCAKRVAMRTCEVCFTSQSWNIFESAFSVFSIKRKFTYRSEFIGL